MDKPLVLTRSVLLLFIIFLALIPLSRSKSRVKTIEGKTVKLEFPYPCNSSRVTIRRANGAPFYNSAQPGYLYLPDDKLNRFSVKEKKCSLQVEIRPVMKDDEATYICKAYKDGVSLGYCSRIRVSVDYLPVIVSCQPSGNHTVGDWVPLECEASVGSADGEILCYQNAKRLPPYNDLVQRGDILKQTIWVTKEYPVFCCSSLPDQPKDLCNCKDYAWDPSGSEINKDPCPTTTPMASGQDVTSKETSESQTIQNLKENTEDPTFFQTVPPTIRNKGIANLRGSVTFTSVIITGVIVFLVVHYLRKKCKKNKTHVETEKMDEHQEAKCTDTCLGR